LLLNASRMRALVIGGVVACASGCWSSGPRGALWRPTGAIAGGAHATVTCLSTCDNYPSGEGPFVDIEGGARRDEIGVTAFARYAYYSDGYLGTRVDDFNFGARVHFWPARWFRLALALGDMADREADSSASPAAAWTSVGFVGLQAAFVLYRDSATQLELGIDLTQLSFPDSDTGLMASIGLGLRI
jgi:hypothetical protein